MVAKKKDTDTDILDDMVRGVKNTSLYEASRKVLLSAAGAAGLATDEMKGFLDKLVERGEIAEQDARRLMVEVLEKREKTERDRRASKDEAKRTTASKADIEDLSARIMELNKMIEALKNQSGPVTVKDDEPQE